MTWLVWLCTCAFLLRHGIDHGLPSAHALFSAPQLLLRQFGHACSRAYINHHVVQPADPGAGKLKLPMMLIDQPLAILGTLLVLHCTVANMPEQQAERLTLTNPQTSKVMHAWQTASIQPR